MPDHGRIPKALAVVPLGCYPKEVIPAPVGPVRAFAGNVEKCLIYEVMATVVADFKSLIAGGVPGLQAMQVINWSN